MEENPYASPVTAAERSTSAFGNAFTLFLIAMVAAALSNSVLGVVGVFSSPFWLPVCCIRLPAKFTYWYLGVSVGCFVATLPLGIVARLIELPEGFVFVFGMGAFFMSVATGLGALIARSNESR